MKKILTFIAMYCFCTILCAQSVNATYRAYIEQYRDIAIAQQKKHGIPASITLAQGILESAAGKSELAMKAKNHFGIKCTSDWTGPTYSHDDNKAGECFRKYSNVSNSFEDHSLFLKRSRYASLFELSVKDYKNWAYGLKACGYATDPKYPEKLIRIIELYDLDKLASGKNIAKTSGDSKKKTSTEDADIEIAFAEQEYMEDYSMPAMDDLELFHNHRSGSRNGVRYIIAGPSETYASLAHFLNMYERTLRKYNDALDGRELNEGDIVYIYPKKNRAERRYTFCHMREGETLWHVSQRYAIKMKSLCKLNGIPNGSTMRTHYQLNLR